jgi:putative ABC transport system ATP-binding protein
VRGPATIEVESVSKRYPTPAGPVDALEDVTLTVEAGAGLAIMGPSGCGKSTLLGLIAGLEAPTDGRVAIGGEVISGMSERDLVRLRREELGLVFQSDNLLPFLTALENVALPLALNGSDDGYSRCAELLARLGLAADSGKLPDQLSGGQRQRVAVARALVKQPGVLLADEPTGLLDEDNSAAIIDLLLEAQRETNCTLVVVTHDAGVAARMDRIVNLRDGRLKET